MKRNRRVSLIRTRGFRVIIFCTGMLLGSAIVVIFQSGLMLRHPEAGQARVGSAQAEPAHHVRGLKEPNTEQRRSTLSPDATTAQQSTIAEADVEYIESRKLLIPVANVTADKLQDSFNQARSEGRRHEAIDIMAPAGTPVLATTDGVVCRLFQSQRGGITLYELDPSGHYIYYYAHLARYADGVVEGKPLHRGDVIAYVGDTGNAGPGNYHLHFAISKVMSPHKWSGGDPLNPYPLLAGG